MGGGPAFGESDTFGSSRQGSRENATPTSHASSAAWVVTRNTKNTPNEDLVSKWSRRLRDGTANSVANCDQGLEVTDDFAVDLIDRSLGLPGLTRTSLRNEGEGENAEE